MTDSKQRSQPEGTVTAQYGLTPTQEGMLFHHLSAPGSGANVEQVLCFCEGEIDAQRLAQAFNQVIAAHPALRTQLCWQGKPLPEQHVRAEVELTARSVDLSSAQGEAQGAQLEQLLADDRADDFDLAQAPLMRLCVIQLSEGHHAFLWTFHHILLDHDALARVLRQVGEAYVASSEGRDLNLEPAASFERYVGSLPKLSDEARSFFGELLDGFESHTPIDVGFAAREGSDSAQRWVDSDPSADAARALRDTAATLLVDPRSVVNAAWALLLRVYSGTEDVVFGVAREGRSGAAASDAVGLLINTLPQRARADFPNTLGLFVKAIDDQYKAQAPYERANPQDVHACGQIPAGSPLFESLTSFEPRSLEQALREAGGVFGTCRVDYRFQTTLPLTLVATLGATLRLRLAFDPSRYDVESARRMLHHLQRMLHMLCTEPATTELSALPVLTPEERSQLLQDFNQTDGPFPDGARMHDLFEAQVAADPTRLAAVCGDEQLTYGELEARANRLAQALLARGVTRGTKVGICLPRSIEVLVSMLAVLKAGGAYVPLDPAYPQDRVRFMLEDTQASVVLTTSELAASLPEGASQYLCLDGDAAAIALESDARPPCQSTPDDLAYIIYTSGSTGKPKGVMVRHRPAVNLIDWVNTTFAVGPSDRLLFVTSICFDLSVYDVFGILGCGGSLHVATSAELREPRRLLDLIDGGSITFWDSAPAALTQLVPFLPETPSNQSRLRLVLLSGDWIPVPLPDQVRAAFPKAEIVSLGGATEATIWSNFYRIREVPARWPSIPYGKPIRNARYYVLDERLEPLPVGVPGHLHIGGLCLADGYHNRPDLSAEKFIADPFSAPGAGKLYRTGDLARFMPDGNIEFLGRIDQQVKVRGFRIELGEIEAVLNTHPGVKTSLVDAPRIGTERTLVAYVVAPEEKPDVSALRESCAAKLPEYMVPLHFVLLDALPVTPNGKVDRRALPTPSSQATAPFVAPRNQVETTVAEIMAGSLGLERMGVHDNFFELGGHSLLAVRVISDLSRVFNYEVSLASFLSSPTVEDVARLLNQRPSGSSRVMDRIEPDLAAAPVVSLEQSRLAFVQGLYPESATYNISTALRLDGEVDPALLERAFMAVAERHEPLRTSFHVAKEGYEAQIHPRIELPLSQHDLSHLTGDEQKAAIDTIMRDTNGVAFDLAKAPLLRTVLITLGPSSHILLFVVHHVVFDGPSTAIFVRELLAFYDALARSAPADLPELPIRFNDAARWQLRRLEEQDYSRDLTYWRERLKGPLPVLQLPHDKPRPRVFSYRGSVMPWHLSKEDSDALRAVAQSQRSSVFTLLLAAFSTLLHRYSGQPDILVAIPVASREQPETRELIGLLLNTLVIRSAFEPGMTFESALSHVRTRFFEALDHRELPFERLVADLNPPRDTSITPVFQAFFSYEETSGRVTKGEHFALSSVVVDQMFAGTDLSLFAEESSEDGLHGYFEFSTDIFERASVEKIAEGFECLLRHIARAPHTQVDLLAVMSNEEREKQLVRWNDTRAGFDLERTTIELFEEKAQQHPDKVAVHSDGASLTYRELLSEARRIAQMLAAQGAGPGRGVAIFLDRGPRLLATLLGVMRTGACYIPLDPTHPEERNQRILRVAAPAVVVVEQLTAKNLPDAAGAAVVDLDDVLQQASGDAPRMQAQPDGVAYIIFTSGSTGDPKGVEIPHRALTNFLLSMAVRPGMGPSDTLLALTTISFDIAGLELYLPLIVGGTVDIGGRDTALDPAALAARLSKHPATLFQATPATFRMLIEDGWTGQAGLKVLCGGEAFPPDLAQALIPRVGSVWNMYGPTETTVWSSLDQLTADDPVISIGHPIHNTEMYVLNDALQPVPRGCAGMLYIGGDGVACGYHRRSDLTQTAFLPDPFSDDPKARIYRTGDLARRLPDGRLECLGRNDFQVKIRGYRIELGEIEAALMSHPEVRQAVVHVKPTPSGDKRLVGYVVNEARSLSLPPGLIEHIREKLPAYMVPSAFMALAAFPLTPNGKVDRKALPEPDVQVQVVAAEATPRNDIELKVAEIFQRHLAIASFGVEDNFFDLGGHSLLAVRLTRELNQTFNLELAVGTLFENPTVAGVAEVVQSGGGEMGAAVVPLASGSGNAPLFFILGIQLYQRLARNVGDGQPSYGIYLPAEEALFDTGESDRNLTIKELASMYVEAIRAHTPTGPYSIGGVSFGGLLAFEVARQLKAAGQEVALLVLLDAVLPRGLTRNRMRWLSRQASSLRRHGLLSTVKRLKHRWEHREDDKAADADRRDAQLWKAFSGAPAQDYFASSPSYEGPTLLIRATNRSELPGFDVAPDLGWGHSLLGPLKIMDSPGAHLEILGNQHTADLLRAELSLQNRRVEREREQAEEAEIPPQSAAGE